MEFADDIDPVDVLNDNMFLVHGFLQSTWLFADNAIDTEVGFLFYSVKGDPTATSNYLSFRLSKARGDRSEITITREKLREIRQFYRDHINPERFNAHPVTKVTKGADRIARAMYVSQGARVTVDIPFKVMHYCSAFETLFSTSQAELSHQLSERVAWFLGETGEERLEIYRTMKKAYGLRSKITHGAPLRERDFAEILNLSEMCDLSKK